MKRWTKADIARLKSALDTFYLVNRPIAPGMGFGYARNDGFVASFREALAKHRVDIIARGIESGARIGHNRAAENRATAAHFEANPDVYGKSTPEMVERFTTLAAEEDRGVKRALALAMRARLEPLPPEVLEYDPSAR
jgi:hypothetical protein